MDHDMVLEHVHPLNPCTMRTGGNALPIPRNFAAFEMTSVSLIRSSPTSTNGKTEQTTIILRGSMS